MALFLQQGCTVKTTRDAAFAPEKELLWPAPPMPARIRYIRSIDSPADLSDRKGKNWFSRAMDFMTGGSNEAALPIIVPYGLSYDESGLLYVADRGARGIHRYDLQGGNAEFIDNVEGVPLEIPVAVALGDKKIYVSDTARNKVYILTLKGALIGEIGGWQRPGGIAFDRKNRRLYVLDVLQGQVSAFDPEGRFLFAFGRRGGGNNELYLPSNIWVDAEGTVYVTDSMNFRVQLFNEEGKHIRHIGKLGDSPGDFARPRGIAVDSEGHIYVVDAEFNNVQIFDQQGRLLLFFGKQGSEAGQFDLPSGIFIDSNDRIYVSDSYNKRIQIFQYLKEGKKNTKP